MFVDFKCLYKPFDLNIIQPFLMSIQAFNNHENKFVLKHYLIKHDEARTKVSICIKVAIINDRLDIHKKYCKNI